MYHQPPPPYAYPGTPAPFGYYPPPSGLRYTSATPSPRGSAQKTRHTRHASQQVPPGYAYSPRGPSFADHRFSQYYNTPLRKPEFDREQERTFERDANATPKANQSRRRASYVDPRSQDRSQTTPPRAKPQPAKRKATEEDRFRCGIPAGYSLKNWDPSEEPIMVLGSVFDANSLGKWIYDWACYAYGTDKPLTDMAAELWLLLIHLAGKFKRADEIIERVRVDSKREMVEDFLESGERLWVRFRKLLKICEDYMWKAAQRESGEKKPANMGAKSGVAFVKCLFGRDCELEKTEKLMANIRLFSIRFEVNIEPIIRHPEADESEVGKDDDSESESEAED